MVDPPNRVEVAAKDIRLVVDEGETAIYFHHGSGMVSWVSKQTLQGRGVFQSVEGTEAWNFGPENHSQFGEGTFLDVNHPSCKKQRKSQSH